MLKKFGVVTGALVAVLGGSIALFSSCGGDSDSGGEPTTTEKTVDDASQALELGVGQIKLSLPAGALEAGSVVSLTEIAVPSEFTALATVPPASKAYDVAATKDGQALTEAKAPFTLAVTLDAAVALTDVEKTDANLCILARTSTASLVWRRAAITLDEAKTSVSVSTQIFAKYMAVFCGSEKLEGFLEVGGNDQQTGQALICDASTLDAKACMYTDMGIKNDSDRYSYFKSLCVAMSGVEKENSKCSDGVAVCAEVPTGSLSAVSTIYYAPETVQTARVKCQAIRDKANAAYTVTFMPTGGQAENLTKSSSAGQATFPLACYTAADKYCTLYRSSDQTAQTISEYCTTSQSGQVGAVCPSEGFVVSCDAPDRKSYWYDGHGDIPQTCLDGESRSTKYSPD